MEKYNTAIQEYLATVITKKEPQDLYLPIKYILSLGGKKLRPVLTLITCNFFKPEFKKAMPAAIALELFHNFSLIHDDIMDQAPLRRGEETVHKKWNLNTAILSGDAMLILAYQLFEAYEPKMFHDLAKLFSKTALEVCEGQQYDVDFETQSLVSIEAYIKMIEYKTAVLIGAAMKMGAIVGEASVSCQENCYEFGLNLGIAFQLQDDYLDAFGNPKTFGKQVGGDIIANKKTYLYIKTLENCNSSEKEELTALFSKTPKDPTTKIERVKELFQKSGAAKVTQNEIAHYTQLANKTLKNIAITDTNKEVLQQFAKELMTRKV